LCLLKKSFRNNDLSFFYDALTDNALPGSGYPDVQVQRVSQMTRHRRTAVRSVKICDYFFLQGLVTWLDTPILSRTIQEVIDARQLV